MCRIRSAVPAPPSGRASTRHPQLDLLPLRRRLRAGDSVDRRRPGPPLPRPRGSWPLVGAGERTRPPAGHPQDHCLLQVAPDAYDTYLTRPRGLTRPTQRTLWAVELDTAAKRAEESDERVRVHRLATLLTVEQRRTGRPFSLLLSDATITTPCGFDPDDLARLRALDEAEIRALVADVLSDGDATDRAA